MSDRSSAHTFQSGNLGTPFTFTVLDNFPVYKLKLAGNKSSKTKEHPKTSQAFSDSVDPIVICGFYNIQTVFLIELQP